MKEQRKLVCVAWVAWVALGWMGWVGWYCGRNGFDQLIQLNGWIDQKEKR